MSPWKAAFGLGAACVACCALPLLGLAGGATATGALTGWISAYGFNSPGWVITIVSVAGLALSLALGAAWRRQRQRRQASQAASCDCTGSCATTPATTCR